MYSELPARSAGTLLIAALLFAPNARSAPEPVTAKPQQGSTRKADPRDAETVLADALVLAKKKQQMVFLHFGGTECDWCKKLEAWIAAGEGAKDLGRQFVVLKIDIDTMTNGKRVQQRYRKSDKGGIPWIAFLDANGEVLAESDQPKARADDPASPKIDNVLGALLQRFGKSLRDQVNSIHDAEIAAIEARTREIKAFKDALNRFDLTKEDQATRAVQFAEENKALWQNETFAPDITSIIAQASLSLSTLKGQKELRSSLEVIEGRLKDSAGQTAEGLSALSRTLNELEPKAAIVGPEFVERVRQALVDVTQAYAIKLHDEARAGAVGGAKGRVALASYTKAEDELARLLQKTQKEPDKATEDLLKAHYVEVIKESDQLCATVFTPEVIEATPWNDLLTHEQVKNWSGSKGFEYRLDTGTLQIVAARDSTKTGVLTIGDRAAWRDFVLHVEFIVESGSPELIFRVPRQVDMRRVESFRIAPGSSGIEAGQPFALDVSFIGNRLVVRVPDSAPLDEKISDSSKARKGGIGILVPAATNLRITQMKVKELR